MVRSVSTTSRPGSERTLRILVNLPTNRVNYKSALERADISILTAALEQLEQNPEVDKTRIEMLRSRLNQLQKLEDSSQLLTESSEVTSKRITYRGTVYAVGEEVEDRNTGDRLVITGFTNGNVAWVKKGESSPYCLGMGHIRKLESPVTGIPVTPADSSPDQDEDEAVLSHGSDPRAFIRESDLQGVGDPRSHGDTARVAELVADLTVELAPIPTTPIDGELLPSPTEHLSQLEAEIETGQQLRAEGERRIWMAAATIRQHELWKLHVDRQGNLIFKSFPDYCKQKWGWERSQSHAIAQTGQVVLQLKQSGVPDKLLPDSVSQGTELARLEPEQRLTVIDRVVEEKGRLSAKAIQEMREQYLLEDNESVTDTTSNLETDSSDLPIQREDPSAPSFPLEEEDAEPAGSVAVRLKVSKRLQGYLERHGGILSVIVQQNEQTYYLQAGDITIEDF
jgi:hypothetical protein